MAGVEGNPPGLPAADVEAGGAAAAEQAPDASRGPEVAPSTAAGSTSATAATPEWAAGFQALLGMIQRLEQKVENLFQQGEDKRVDARSVEEINKKVEQLTAKESRRSIGSDRKIAFTQMRGMESLPKFSGKLEDFDAWRTRVLAVLAPEKGVESLLLEAEKMKWQEIDDAAVENMDDLECNMDSLEVSTNMYSLLITKTHEEAFRMVRNAGHNQGLKAWSKLVHHFNLVTAQGRRKILSRLMHPTRMKTYEEINSAQEEWDQLLQKYQETAKVPLSQDVLIVGFMEILPLSLVKDINALPYEFESLSELRGYVQKQVLAQRDESRAVAVSANQCKWEEQGKGWSTSGDGCAEGGHHFGCNHGFNPFPDEQAVLQCLGCEDTEENRMLIGSLVQKGKGNGKGKGQGPVCYHCGQAGHTRSNCKAFDQVMEQRRAAGGKGFGKAPEGNGKGGFGNKGGGFGAKGGGKGLQKGLAMALGQLTGMPWGGSAPTNSAGNQPIRMCVPCQEESDAPRPVHKIAPWYHKNKFQDLAAQDEEEDEESCQISAISTTTCPSSAGSATDPERHPIKKGNPKLPRAKKWQKAPELLGAKLVGFASPDPLPARALTENWVKKEAGWIKIESDMDSGCVQSVAPPSICPEIPIEDSAGSKMGQKYMVADGSTVPNLGQKTIQGAVLSCGKQAAPTYQIADVTNPLTSVGDVADEGNIVIFGAQGGVVLDLVTHSLTPFPRVDRRYKWEFWIPDSTEGSASTDSASRVGVAPMSGFTRQGQ